MAQDRANVALTGFMGAGKTVVGRSLAESLGWAFVDLDAVIEAGEGSSVREIFDRCGEPYFRKREKVALGRVLDGNGQVIALGGGAVLDPDNRRLLKKRAVLVWLRVTPLTVLRRTRGSEDRPLLQETGAPAGGGPASARGRAPAGGVRSVAGAACVAGARVASVADSEVAKLKRIETLSAQREQVYAEADVALDTDALTVDQVVQRIRRQLWKP